MKTIIAGSRTILDEQILIDLMPKLGWDITEIVSGNARGADTLGEVWAYYNSIQIKYFRPDWKKFGRGAGFIRNEEMAVYGDSLILLWDGISRGSTDMLTRARNYNLRIHVELIK